MKAYKIYGLYEYGIESDIEYALRYSKAIHVFNDKVREMVKELKGDLVTQKDFSEEVRNLKEECWNDRIEIISRKMPYILYRRDNKLFASVFYWEKTSHEYNEWDIRDMTIALEEIMILE